MDNRFITGANSLYVARVTTNLNKKISLKTLGLVNYFLVLKLPKIPKAWFLLKLSISWISWPRLT